VTPAWARRCGFCDDDDGQLGLEIRAMFPERNFYFPPSGISDVVALSQNNGSFGGDWPISARGRHN